MEKHPMAGTPVKIENGSLKGHYFKVIDYLKNQYQGKDIEKLAKTQAQLITPVIGRGMPLDDYIVFGQLYPTMEYTCVHDKELKIVQPPLKLVQEEDPELHAHGKEAENDSGNSTESDSGPSVAGQASDGRAVSSDGVLPKNSRQGKKSAKKD